MARTTYKRMHGPYERLHILRDSAWPRDRSKEVWVCWERDPCDCYRGIDDRGWLTFTVDDFGNLVESLPPFDGVL